MANAKVRHTSRRDHKEADTKPETTNNEPRPALKEVEECPEKDPAYVEELLRQQDA